MTTLTEQSPTCQRCHQPLILDPTIISLTPSQHSLITSALPSPSPPSNLSPHTKLSSLPANSRDSAQIWQESNGLRASPYPKSVGESFVLLSDSVMSPSNNKGGPSNYTARTPSLPNSLNANDMTRTNTTTTISASNLASNLHSILSSRTPISHPLCTDCTNHLQVELQKQLEELSRERDAYIAFERGIARNRDNLKSGKGSSSSKRQHPHRKGDDENGVDDDGDEELGEYDLEGTEDDWSGLNMRREKLIKEEEELRKILAKTEDELEVVRKEEQLMKLEEEAVDREETEFLQSHLSLTSTLRALQSTLQTSQTHLLLSQSLLQSLESTNVYNDAFQIGQTPLLPADTTSNASSTFTSGQPTSSSSRRSMGGNTAGGMMVGTINGLRLGGRPMVEWEEINAAWGLVALCIDRIAVKVGCVFQGYKVVPLGSFSRIEELPPKRGSYELYASSDIALGRVFQNRRFDSALVALLECLRQLVEFGRKDERGWGGGGIEINKDKISGYSIKLPGIANTMLPSMSVMGFGSSSSSSPTASIIVDSHSNVTVHSNSSTSPSSAHAQPHSSTSTQTQATPDEIHTKACAAVLRVLKRILLVESENERGTTLGSGGGT